MSLLLPGVYIAADTPLHRLDPRIKMAAATWMTILPFVALDWKSAIVLSAFIACIASLSAVPLGALWHTLRTTFWLGFFMFFFYAFTVPGQVLIALGKTSITWEGLLAGVVQIYRLCLLVIVSALLSYTTSPIQLTHGIEALLKPLTKIGLPVRELAMVLTIALRFVPTLSQEIAKITKAQRARGLDPTGNPLQRIRGWVPLFVPIFVSAFRRADQLATAMEARGFRSAHQRTRLYQLHLTRQDLVASVVVLAFSLAIIGAGYL